MTGVMRDDDLTVMTEPEVAVLSTVFTLLADATRLRILLLLCPGERRVSELVALLGMPQPTVSHHLGLMRRAGLLATRRERKSIFYSLDGRLALEGGGCELRIGTAAGVKIRISAGHAAG